MDMPAPHPNKHRRAPMDMPAPLKAVRIFSWFQIGVAALALVVLFLSGALHPGPHSLLGHTRNGIVRALHAQPKSPADSMLEITPGDGRGGVTAGKIFVYSLLPILMLRFIRKRNRNGMVIVSGVLLIETIGRGGFVIIPLMIFVATLLRSTRRYVEQNSEEIPIPRVIRSSQYEG